MLEIIFALIIALALLIAAFLLGRYLATKGMVVMSESEFAEFIEAERDDAIKRSRAVLGGQFSEQLAPYLPNFKYSPTEVRFIGKPIDFVVFKGMDSKEISEIVFVEVKSGNANMNSVERSIQKAIDTGKVKWEEYRIPKGLTDKKAV
ncbi:MAG: hypothetical protein N3H30_01175 [Candidatus Micrarchaeota archaeon]|nr:hypothetical protein [Candidatus Micrarchaeota archaeon]